MSSSVARRSLLLTFLATGALARWDNVTRRDADPSQFAADSSFDINAIMNFVKSGGNTIATYPTCNDCDYQSDVELQTHSEMDKVITFIADMDIDCDGVNWQCPGNPDGQAQTNWGQMDTYQAPWYVLPDEWYDSQGIVANNIGAVICDGKMFYAIFADSNGDSPQVIGEGSLALGNACFPNAGLSGANGHPEKDVAYIVFAGEAPDGVTNETVDYGSLKALGDKKVRELLSAIGSTPGNSGGGESDPGNGSSGGDGGSSGDDGDDGSSGGDEDGNGDNGGSQPEQPEQPEQPQQPQQPQQPTCSKNVGKGKGKGGKKHHHKNSRRNHKRSNIKHRSTRH